MCLLYAIYEELVLHQSFLGVLDNSTFQSEALKLNSFVIPFIMKETFPSDYFGHTPYCAQSPVRDTVSCKEPDISVRERVLRCSAVALLSQQSEKSVLHASCLRPRFLRALVV